MIHFRWRRLILALGLALLITGILPALAAPTTSSGSELPKPPTYAKTAKFQERLAEAQQKFPDAAYELSGVVTHPGRYLIQISDEDVALADIRVEVVRVEHRGKPQRSILPLPVLHAFADTGQVYPVSCAWGPTGDWYYFYLDSNWYVGPAYTTHLQHKSYNVVEACVNVNSSIDRVVCEGLGACEGWNGSSTGWGVIDNNTWRTNPYYDQRVIYSEAGGTWTQQFNARQYINSATEWSAWVNAQAPI